VCSKLNRHAQMKVAEREEILLVISGRERERRIDNLLYTSYWGGVGVGCRNNSYITQ